MLDLMFMLVLMLMLMLMLSLLLSCCVLIILVKNFLEMVLWAYVIFGGYCQHCSTTIEGSLAWNNASSKKAEAYIAERRGRGVDCLVPSFL